MRKGRCGAGLCQQALPELHASPATRSGQLAFPMIPSFSPSPVGLHTLLPTGTPAGFPLHTDPPCPSRFKCHLLQSLPTHHLDPRPRGTCVPAPLPREHSRPSLSVGHSRCVSAPPQLAGFSATDTRPCSASGTSCTGRRCSIVCVCAGGRGEVRCVWREAARPA